jgi:putative transcription factor
MQCEMCGSETEVLLKTDIEGSVLNVCRNCAAFGKVMGEVRTAPKQRKSEKRHTQEREMPAAIHDEQEPILVIVPGFSQKIKEAREKRGLDQAKFAKQINEKDSLIHKLETGTIEPSIKLAHKIEQFLGITLVQEYKDEKIASTSDSAKQVTIGDMIRLRKR